MLKYREFLDLTDEEILKETKNLMKLQQKLQLVVGMMAKVEIMKMICLEKHKGIGFLRQNHDESGNVNIKIGDCIDCDWQGYLWFKDVCFGHKDGKPGRKFKLAEEI